MSRIISLTSLGWRLIFSHSTKLVFQYVSAGNFPGLAPVRDLHFEEWDFRIYIPSRDNLHSRGEKLCSYRADQDVS